MDTPILPLERRPPLRLNRTSYLLLGLMLATIAAIGLIWWPLLDEALATFHPDYPWWIQLDWLLLGIFALMATLIMIGADLKRDARLAAVALLGGLVIESWGTQTELWNYYTFERPPLWILPAWPVAALAIDRLATLARRLAKQLGPLAIGISYVVTSGSFLALMLPFVWPTRNASLTLAALVLCVFLIVTPVQPRTAVATFLAGTALGYFLELWGTTRLCWTYYTQATPPAFAVLAHGMAAVAFWRSERALRHLAVALLNAWRTLFGTKSARLS